MKPITTQIIDSTSQILKTSAKNKQSYWTSFGKMLDEGVDFFNPKTGKTIFTNKKITAIIKGELPAGSTTSGGRIELNGDLWNPASKPINESLPLESYYLFQNPCSISSKQNEVLQNLEKFIVNA